MTGYQELDDETLNAAKIRRTIFGPLALAVFASTCVGLYMMSKRLWSAAANDWPPDFDMTVITPWALVLCLVLASVPVALLSLAIGGSPFLLRYPGLPTAGVLFFVVIALCYFVASYNAMPTLACNWTTEVQWAWGNSSREPRILEVAAAMREQGLMRENGGPGFDVLAQIRDGRHIPVALLLLPFLVAFRFAMRVVRG